MEQLNRLSSAKYTIDIQPGSQKWLLSDYYSSARENGLSRVS
ncbi:hypothetical protein J4731_04200 [Providencia rettgeri]|nr:hypothetical protein [Providencia rettgeri]